MLDGSEIMWADMLKLTAPARSSERATNPTSATPGAGSEPEFRGAEAISAAGGPLARQPGARGIDSAMLMSVVDQFPRSGECASPPASQFDPPEQEQEELGWRSVPESEPCVLESSYEEYGGKKAWSVKRPVPATLAPTVKG